jgi:hypothetical protein
VAVLCLNPIQVLKVNIQNSATRITVAETFEGIWSKRGIFGFWGGAKMGLLQALPSTVIYMTAYENFKEQFKTLWFGPAVAGAAGRFVSCSVISPLELIKTIQTGGSRQTAVQLLRGIYAREGYRGFYRGWWSSIMRDCPFSAIYWFSFETLQPKYHTFYASQLAAYMESRTATPGYDYYSTHSHLVTFLSGVTSGVFAAVSTHPFDVIKTQQQLARHVVRPISKQLEPGTCCSCMPVGILLSAKEKLCVEPTTTIEPGQASKVRKYDCSNVKVEKCRAVPVDRTKIGVWKLYRMEGMSSLFRGLTMRLATVIPSSAIVVTVYKGINELD